MCAPVPLAATLDPVLQSSGTPPKYSILSAFISKLLFNRCTYLQSLATECHRCKEFWLTKKKMASFPDKLFGVCGQGALAPVQCAARMHQ